jgi:hypothetical protein
MTWRVPNPQELYQPIRIALGALSKYLDQMESENNPKWIAVTAGVGFQNGWVDYGAPWQVAGYRKLRNGNVEMRGLVKNGTHGLVIFTLPVGYRPPNYLLKANINNNALGRLNIDNAGGVYSETAIGGNGFVDLNFTFSTQV